MEDLSNLKLKLINHDEGLNKEVVLSSLTNLQVDSLLPGMYTITISGRAKNTDGESFLMGGGGIGISIFTNSEVELEADGVKIQPLIFKEIYYCGSKTPTNGNWFRDQFYEIYNNSLDMIYIDGLYFANVVPNAASATKVAEWPASDGDKYTYAERIWKIPGNGTDYPLAPGESFVISQFAVNHQLPIYNPNSPINCHSSEFEFNMNNPNFPDQPAVNMIHTFYNGNATIVGLQYLTPFTGGAFIIFKVPEGDVYDPVNNPGLKTIDLSGNLSKTNLYGKVPRSYVLDAVEAGDNENMAKYKRMPTILDAGMVTLGGTYLGLSVARKKIDENPDGTPILQDTNNSTEDFDTHLKPQFRRYGSKMPAWNHTLQGQ